MLTEQQKIERAGKITASQAYRIMGAKGLGQGGTTYMRELIAEERGCLPKEAYSSAIEHGNIWEPEAREQYSAYTGLEVEEPGFIIPEFNKNIGATPDGYVKKLDIGCEIKCPETGSTHVAFLELEEDENGDCGESLKKLCARTTSSTVKHLYWQIMFSLYVTGWDAWHFVTFHPYFSNPKIGIFPVLRNEADIKLIEQRIIEALAVKKSINNKIS